MTSISSTIPAIVPIKQTSQQPDAARDATPASPEPPPPPVAPATQTARSDLSGSGADSRTRNNATEDAARLVQEGLRSLEDLGLPKKLDLRVPLPDTLPDELPPQVFRPLAPPPE